MDSKALGWCTLGGAVALGTSYVARRFAARPAEPVVLDRSHHRLSTTDASWAPEPGIAKEHDGGRGTRVFRVVMTGGPCGGKSSSLSKLSVALNKIGYDVYCVPEVPTLMLNGGCRYPGLDGGFRLQEFEGGLIQLQLQVERTFTRVAASTGRPSVVICDRGLLDIKAYLPQKQWNEILAESSMSEEYIIERYDAVLHLVTAAQGAEAFYKHGHVLDDDGGGVIRAESPAAARTLDDKMRLAWKNHPRHGIIANLDDGFEGKLSRATGFVLSLINTA